MHRAQLRSRADSQEIKKSWVTENRIQKCLKINTISLGASTVDARMPLLSIATAKELAYAAATNVAISVALRKVTQLKHGDKRKSGKERRSSLVRRASQYERHRQRKVRSRELLSPHSSRDALRRTAASAHRDCSLV